MFKSIHSEQAECINYLSKWRDCSAMVPDGLMVCFDTSSFENSKRQESDTALIRQDPRIKGVIGILRNMLESRVAI